MLFTVYMLEKLHSCVFAGGRCRGPTLHDATLHVLEKHKDNTSRGCMVICLADTLNSALEDRLLDYPLNLHETLFIMFVVTGLVTLLQFPFSNCFYKNCNKSR